MLKQLMKNAEDLENLDKLLDSSNKSYSDSKSKKSSLEINFLFRYGQFGSGTVFFATPCISVDIVGHYRAWHTKPGRSSSLVIQKWYTRDL